METLLYRLAFVALYASGALEEVFVEDAAAQG